jgi:hypothetical protein
MCANSIVKYTNKTITKLLLKVFIDNYTFNNSLVILFSKENTLNNH